MTFCRLLICVFSLLLFAPFDASARDDDKAKIKVITDWKDDEKPIRVDCHNLPIIGGGIGGASQSCAARLSLYASLSCFPMKREDVEATCPEWQGLKADIDWKRIAELIDARTDAEDKKMRERGKQDFEPQETVEESP